MYRIDIYVDSNVKGRFIKKKNVYTFYFKY